MNLARFASLRRSYVGCALVVFAALGCSKSCSEGAGAGGSSDPCDPLTPPPVTLGAILGVGKDSQSIFYLADEVPDGGGQDSVFVSKGNTLYRKHVAGSGAAVGRPPNADYTFSFQDPFAADAWDTRALLIQVRGGAVTGMALGAGNSRSVYAPDAGDEMLTVLDAGAIAGFKLQNLPVLVEYVAEVSNGAAIVVTEPMDPWGYSGFRLFYGVASQMVERPIVDYNRGDTSDDISFTVDGTKYAAHIAFVSTLFSGEGGTPGPSSLDTGGQGTLQMTVRMPSPTSLSGFSFTCLE